MKEPATIHLVSLNGRIALERWGVGYDMFVVGPNGLLVEWCRKGLLMDVYCVLGEDKELAKAAWKNAAESAGETKLTPTLAEALVFEVDALAHMRLLVPREGYPPYPCECGRVGEPTIAMTTLGDGTDLVGLWCRSCRNRVAFAEIDDRAIPLLPPGRWLPHERMLPEIGDKWPERREDPTTAFPFGANVA